jgi:hypothetical protein
MFGFSFSVQAGLENCLLLKPASHLMQAHGRGSVEQTCIHEAAFLSYNQKGKIQSPGPIEAFAGIKAFLYIPQHQV